MDPLARGPAARSAFEASAPHDARAPLRVLGEQALSRAAGAPLIAGNRVRLLRDAPEY